MSIRNSKSAAEAPAMPPQRPRADVTRERIADAARRLFAEHGYERATIRAIAAEARIDPSLVMRYFGSKDALFAAVATFDLRLPDPARIPREEVGRRLVRHFLSVWDGDSGLAILLRAASSNEAARERMRETFRTQVMPMVARAVDDPREAALRAELLASQMMGLAFCRFIVRLPRLSGADAAMIEERIGAAVQQHLFGR